MDTHKPWTNSTRLYTFTKYLVRLLHPIIGIQPFQTHLHRTQHFSAYNQKQTPTMRILHRYSSRKSSNIFLHISQLPSQNIHCHLHTNLQHRLQWHTPWIKTQSQIILIDIIHNNHISIDSYTVSTSTTLSLAYYDQISINLQTWLYALLVLYKNLQLFCLQYIRPRFYANTFSWFFLRFSIFVSHIYTTYGITDHSSKLHLYLPSSSHILQHGN